MSPRICPQCGAPQQWEMWRRCPCGYDFGPPATAALPQEGVFDTRRYRTFWLRFCAGFLDGLVFFPVMFVDSVLLTSPRHPAVLIGWGVVSYSVYWIYSVVLHARYGQTLGKMAAKVQVLDVSEERIPTLRQALLRDSGYIVLNTLALLWFIYLVLVGRFHSSLDLDNSPDLFLSTASLGWVILEFVTMLTNRKRRALHDLIAGTVVVRLDETSLLESEQR